MPCTTSENRISFSVTPSILSKSGDWVTVSWQKVEYPNSSDWIGVYSPPINDIYRIDPVNHSPIKFQVCTTISFTSLCADHGASSYTRS